MGTPLPWDQATDLGYGRGRASARAAASILRIDKQLGRAADINEAWRSPEQANANRARWLAYAAGRGPKAPYALGAEDSVHCWGDAADSDDWYNAWAAAIWRDNGWRQTARYSDSRDEPWHGEYFLHLDNHLGEPAGLSAEDLDMPLTQSDLIAILNAQFKVTQRGQARMVSIAQGLEAVFVVGDILSDLIKDVPAEVWAHRLQHPLATDDGKPASIPAGDFLRYEPAEHANTRAAVSKIVTGDVDASKLAVEIAARYPKIDVQALAVAAADEADRRERKRLGS